MDGLSRLAPRCWRAGAIAYDERGKILCVDGVPRAIEPIPRRLLHRLLSAGGDIVAKETLIDSVWRSTRGLSDASFYNAMRRLRATLGEAGRDLVALEPGRGYRITAPVIAVPSVAPSRPALTLAAGDLVPGRADWRLAALLGTGTRRRVWRAVHEGTGGSRIFKFAEDAARRESLRREMRASRRLREAAPEEDGFVPVLEAALDAHPAWLEMEDGGPNLAVWAKAAGGLAALTLARRVALLADAAAIVGAAHEVGVLHGDLTAAQILIDDSAGAPRVRLAGFEAENGFNRPAHPCTAPELVAGGLPTVAADIHALGVLLYQLVAGDLDRKLAAGWERDVDDPLLRADIADAASGNPARRLPSATTLAERLLALDSRRGTARKAVAAARQAAEQQEAAREAAGRLAHAAALARRTRLAALILLALAIVSSGMAAVAWQKQRTAILERKRAAAIADTLEGTVSDLIDTLTRSLRDRAGVTLAVRNEILGEAERALAKMGRLAPQMATQRLEARALAEVADVYRHEGDAERAALAAERAAGLQTALLAQSPDDDTLRTELAQSGHRLGDARLDARQLASALAAYRESLAGLQALSARHPNRETLLRQVADGHAAIGRVLDEQGNAAGALAAFQKALAIAEQGHASHPADADWLDAVSTGHIRMCDAFESLGKPKEALAACQAGLVVMQTLYERDPANTRRQHDLAVAWEDVGDEQELLGDLAASLTAYRHSAAFKQSLAAADPGNMEWQKSLAMVNADIGDIEAKQGEYGRAIASYREGLTIADRLLAGTQQSLAARRLMATYENNLAQYLSRSGDPSGARPHADRALAAMRRLVSERPDDGALKLGLIEVQGTEAEVQHAGASQTKTNGAEIRPASTP